MKETILMKKQIKRVIYKKKKRGGGHHIRYHKLSKREKYMKQSEFTKTRSKTINITICLLNIVHNQFPTAYSFKVLFHV